MFRLPCFDFKYKIGYDGRSAVAKDVCTPFLCIYLSVSCRNKHCSLCVGPAMPIFISHHGCLVHKRICISCPLFLYRSSARRTRTQILILLLLPVSVCWFSTRCIRRLLLSFVAYKRNIFLLICARPCIGPASFLRDVFSLSRPGVLVSGHLHIQPVHIGHKRPQPNRATRNFNILCIQTNIVYGKCGDCGQ